MRTLIAILLIGCGGSLLARTDQEDKALAVAEVAVKNVLTSPSAAKFCRPDEAEISWQNGNIIVMLWVDAKNAYGTPMRQHWGVALDPDTFEVKEKVCKELLDAAR